MSSKQQTNNIFLAVGAFTLVVVLVGLMGYFFLGKTPETIQGEVDADNYRVSSKLPGRVVKLYVKEGDYVHVGDTLAILQVPEMDAQEKVAAAAGDAATALSDMAHNGARREAVTAAHSLYLQAVAAADIAGKTYNRMENLYAEDVVSRQKRDEAKAAFDAAQAAVQAAKSQWQMAREGARQEEKQAADKQAQAARHGVDVVKSLLKETVQVSPVEGEVSDIYPVVGELVGIGSPIMTIDMLNNLWGVFNVREDQLSAMAMGHVFKAYSPAFNREIRMKVFHVKDQGAYAVWKATKNTDRYDLKTMEVKARPLDKIDGLRPGMTLVVDAPKH